jgi:hypothetical protein
MARRRKRTKRSTSVGLSGRISSRRKLTGAKKKKLRQNPDWITASAVRIRKAGRKLMLDILR